MDNFFQEYYKTLVISEMMNQPVNILGFAVLFISLFYVFNYHVFRILGIEKKSSALFNTFNYGFFKVILIGSFIALTMGNLGFYLASIHSNEMVKNTICMGDVRGIDVPSYLKTFDKVSEADREPFRGVSLGEAIDTYCVGTIIRPEAKKSTSGNYSEIDIPGVSDVKLIKFDKADIIVNF